MNRKRKRLTLSTGVDHLLTPNFNQFNYHNPFNKQFKSLKLRENTNNRQQLFSYRWLFILLILGPLISLVKYVNSQTATDLLVAPNNAHLSSAETNVNNFFHSNGHLLENHFTSEFPGNLGAQSDQLVSSSTVHHLATNKNSKQPTAAATATDQRSNQLVNNKKAATTSTPNTSSSNTGGLSNSSSNNKNRSTRTNARADNRRLKSIESKRPSQTNNKTANADSLSSASTQSTSQLTSQTAVATSKSTPSTIQATNQSANEQANRPPSTNEKRTTKENGVVKSENSESNESKVDSSRTVAGNRPRKTDLNLDEIAEESLKVESIGPSSVEYITEDEEKKSNQPSGEEANAPASSNDLLNTGYKLNADNENPSENNIYTDSQGEYLFNHQTLPHKMQYETEIQRLDGKWSM